MYWRFGLLLTMLTLLLPAAADAKRVVAPSEWHQCLADTDCKLFKAQCGLCSGGDDDYEAYNTKWAQKFDVLRHKVCRADYALLPPEDHGRVWVRACPRNLAPRGHAKCVQGSCRLVDGLGLGN